MLNRVESCYGEGTCSGNSGILVDSDAKLFFISSCAPTSETFVSADTKFKTWGPLDFDSVDLAK